MADSWRIHGGFMAQGGSIGFEFARGMSDKARGEYRFSSLMKPKRREKLRCLLLCRKRKFLFSYL